MEDRPLISVIMAVYNEEKYIEQSLSSILNQTQQDFEIIIFDDCSIDGTVKIINSMHDDRIRLYQNKENKGLTKNLNQGLKLARGRYIARMDGDDISLPTRFEKQAEYLTRHSDVMLISCWTQDFGESYLSWKLPDQSEELKVRMLIRPVFAHPGFMMKRELIEKGYYYDETFRTAQDYELASRVAQNYKIGIVQEVLLYYRVHRKQISNVSGKEQFNNADRVRERLWEQTGVLLNPEDKKVLQSWAKEEKPGQIEKYEMANSLIHKMIEVNRTSDIYGQDILEITLKRLLYLWLIRSKCISYLLAFPKICRYQWKDMVLFVGELLKTIKEKILGRSGQKNVSAIIKAENL